MATAFRFLPCGTCGSSGVNYGTFTNSLRLQDCPDCGGTGYHSGFDELLPEPFEYPVRAIKGKFHAFEEDDGED